MRDLQHGQAGSVIHSRITGQTYTLAPAQECLSSSEQLQLTVAGEDGGPACWPRPEAMTRGDERMTAEGTCRGSMY